MTRQPDPAPALDLDAIENRATWVASTGFAAGDNARRLVAEDVPALLALARRLLAEQKEIDEARLCCYDVHRALVRAVTEHVEAGHDQAGRLTRALAENPGGEQWAATVDRLRAERDAARAVLRPLLEEPMREHDEGDGDVYGCLFCDGPFTDGAAHEDGCPVLDRARLLGDAAGAG